MKFKPVSLKRKAYFSSTSFKRFFLIPFSIYIPLSIKLGPEFLLTFLYMLEAHKRFLTSSLNFHCESSEQSITEKCTYLDILIAATFVSTDRPQSQTPFHCI